MAQIAGYDDNGNPLYVQADGSISSANPDEAPMTQAQRAQDIYNRTGQNVQQTMAEARRMFEQSGIQQAYPGVTFDQYLQIHGINPIDVDGEQWASYPTKEFNWGLGTQTDLGEALKYAGLAFGGMAGLNGLGLLGGEAAAAGAAGASPYSLTAGGPVSFGAGGSALPNALGAYNSLAGAAAGEIGAGLGASLGTGSITGLPGATSLTGLDALVQGGSNLPSMPPTPNLPGTTSPTLPTTPGGTGTIIDGVPPVGTAAGAAGALGSAGSSGAQGILSKIMDGTATADDWMKIAGQVGATGLGVLGSLNQTNAIKDLANQTRAERAPALNAFNSALADPSSWYSSAPAMGATDAVLRKLSVNGNPALNPGDLSKAAAYNLGGYNDYLRTMGNLGLSGQATNAQLGLEGVKSQGNIYNVLGAGLNDLTQPKPDYAKGVLDLFKNSLV